MLKKIFFALLILLPFISIAQNNTGIPIPMKKKIVFYDKSVPVEGGFIKHEFLIAAAKWFKNTFPGNAEPFHIDASGDINCTGIFKINTSPAGDYYHLRFKLEIASNDTGYTIRAYNFYENSNVKGRSHEYSKIEYRWRDYRKGKPWSPADKALFMGLDSDMTVMFKSFGNDPSIIQSARGMHTPKFKVLAFFSTNVEDDHVDFAYQAIKFYKKMADQKGSPLIPPLIGKT